MESGEVISKVRNALYSYSKIIPMEFPLSATLRRSDVILDSALSVWACVTPAAVGDSRHRVLRVSPGEHTGEEGQDVRHTGTRAPFEAFAAHVSQGSKQSFRRLKPPSGVFPVGRRSRRT